MYGVERWGWQEKREIEEVHEIYFKLIIRAKDYAGFNLGHGGVN